MAYKDVRAARITSLFRRGICVSWKIKQPPHVGAVNGRLPRRNSRDAHTF
jgi:hypothetical protein